MDKRFRANTWCSRCENSALILRVFWFEVICTTSSQEAIALVQSRRPDIVLLDIIMPEMDGCQVLEKLRSFTQLPVIAFSASPGNRDRAMLLGANDFMAKPFDPDEMARRIEAILSC